MGRIGDWRDRLSARQNQIAVGGLAAILFLYMVGLAPYVIFGNDVGVAWAVFITVTVTYIASSFASKLALSAKLKKHNIKHPQLNPRMTYRKMGLTVVISLAFGGVAGASAYLSPETVDYSDFNYAVMVMMIATAPVAAVLLSWFDV